jgi:hypothetical protein
MNSVPQEAHFVGSQPPTDGNVLDAAHTGHVENRVPSGSLRIAQTRWEP